MSADFVFMEEVMPSLDPSFDQPRQKVGFFRLVERKITVEV
jgi:hypothetical protein